MNPLSNVRFIKELNQREIRLGIKESSSWHNEYKDSAWVFIGGLPYELTEGDILAVFSQYGEIVNINLVRDKATGKSKGYCFLCYEDQRSTILTVDNLNGIKLLKRTIRVDHVANYRMPKDHEDTDDVTLELRAEGCAPSMPSTVKVESDSDEGHSPPQTKKHKKVKAKKAKKKKKKSSKKQDGSSSSETEDTSTHDVQPVPVKREKIDPGYMKYENGESGSRDTHNTKSRHPEARKPPADARKHASSSGDSYEQMSRARTSRSSEKDRTKNSKSNHREEGVLSHTSSSSSHNRLSASLESDHRIKQRRSPSPSSSTNRHVHQSRRNKSGTLSQETASSKLPPYKYKGKRDALSGSPDKTRDSRQDRLSAPLNTRDKSYRTRSISADREQQSLSPQPKHRTQIQLSRSPDRSSYVSRKVSQSNRRDSRSISPNERNFATRGDATSPTPKRRNERRDDEKRRVSPVPGRQYESQSRSSRSPPSKRKNDYRRGGSRSPGLVQDTVRRASRSPLIKRRNHGDLQRSCSPEQDSRYKKTVSQTASRKYVSSRQISRSPSPDRNSYLKRSSRVRSPVSKYDSRDHKRKNR